MKVLFRFLVAHGRVVDVIVLSLENQGNNEFSKTGDCRGLLLNHLIFNQPVLRDSRQLLLALHIKAKGMENVHILSRARAPIHSS